jgi:hypothetical protein
MANGHGGRRPNSGRKPVHDEHRVRDLAIAAIVDVHGSEENGFRALLRTNEPALVKWVYEHGYGKPKEVIDLNSKVEQTIIIDVDDDEDIEDDGTDNVEETEDDDRYDKESELLDDEDE